MSVTLNFLSLSLLLPACFMSYCRPQSTNLVKWSLLLLAVVGSLIVPLNILATYWGAGVAFSLRVTLLAILLVYCLTCLIYPFAHRLGILIFPYLLVLGVGAAGLSTLDDSSHVFYSSSKWIFVHIISSVLTYALISLSAIVSLAVYLSQRSLKGKKNNKLVALLPAINEGNKLQTKLLIFAQLILFCGLLTGVILQYFNTKTFLVFDHKTVLTTLAFLIIGFVVYLQERSGIRGKIAVRFIMFAYLMLTLAYPGVKFVGQILL